MKEKIKRIGGQNNSRKVCNSFCNDYASQIISDVFPCADIGEPRLLVCQSPINCVLSFLNFMLMLLYSHQFSIKGDFLLSQSDKKKYKPNATYHMDSLILLGQLKDGCHS